MKKMIGKLITRPYFWRIKLKMNNTKATYFFYFGYYFKNSPGCFC